MPTRRRILQSAALAAAAAPFASLVAQPAKQAPVKLGLASYTFRNFARAQLIQFMKQLHVDALNAKDVKDHLPFDPSGDPTSEAAALADYAAAAIPLHAAGTISFTTNNEADIHAKFEYARRAGIPVIVAGDPTPGNLPLIEKFVRQYDIRFAIHNHGPEDKLWHSPLDVLKAVKDMDTRIGCCIDVGHCARAGVDPVHAIQAVGPRLFNMHIKDLTSFQDKESQVPVGEGIMPIRDIFQALIAQHYQGFVDLEYEIHPEDPMPGVIASFAFMRGVLNSMAAN
jgi:sugar phosphate isomerase/epimerase